MMDSIYDSSINIWQSCGGKENGINIFAVHLCSEINDILVTCVLNKINYYISHKTPIITTSTISINYAFSRDFVINFRILVFTL